MPDILKVSGLRCRFGGLKAVDDVSFPWRGATFWA